MARLSAISSSRANVVPCEAYGDFLNRIVIKENTVVERPAPLSVEQHTANRKMLANVCFIQPKFADGTEINICGIFGKWKRYVLLPLVVCQVTN